MRAMEEPLPGLELPKVDVRVGSDTNGAVARMSGKQQLQAVCFCVLIQCLFRITGLSAAHSRGEPNLKEMDTIFWGRIEFTVQDSPSGAYVLEVAGFDDATVAHRVFVLQFTLDHVTEDFGVLMRVLTKSEARLDDIVINDAKRAKAHMIGIKIIAK